MNEYIVSVFKKFVPLNGTGIPVSEHIEDIIEGILKNESIICICEEGKGVIIGIVYPTFWNPDVLVAQEIGWWVEPEYRKTSLGIRLLTQFEERAREKGAQKCYMIALESSSPDKVGGIYEKSGYSLLEHTYMKGL